MYKIILTSRALGNFFCRFKFEIKNGENRADKNSSGSQKSKLFWKFFVLSSKNVQKFLIDFQCSGEKITNLLQK